MEKIIIRGGVPVSGAVTVHGAKNSALPILAACALCSGRCVITRCPDILDVDAAAEILRYIGCRAERLGSAVVVDGSDACGTEISPSLMRRMRASVIFLGPLLGRHGAAEISLPGGCSLGGRPIDYHITALEHLGVEWEQSGQSLHFRWPRRRGGEIILPFPSVGATENVILAAVTVPEPVILRNAAREPEVEDLCGFLSAMGAEISGGGTDTVCIHGGRSLTGAAYAVMPDRIETATYLALGAACGGSLCIHGARAEHLEPVIRVLREAGCGIHAEKERILIRSSGRLRAPGEIYTDVYPGFPTDAQAPVMAALLRAEGETVFHETVFTRRFRHVDQLRKFGADISTNASSAVVRGVPQLHAAHAAAEDLRGGAGVLIAALQAEGESVIHRAELIRRGYAGLEESLRALGAEIHAAEDGA